MYHCNYLAFPNFWEEGWVIGIDSIRFYFLYLQNALNSIMTFAENYQPCVKEQYGKKGCLMHYHSWTTEACEVTTYRTSSFSSNSDRHIVHFSWWLSSLSISLQVFLICGQDKCRSVSAKVKNKNGWFGRKIAWVRFVMVCFVQIQHFNLLYCQRYA